MSQPQSPITSSPDPTLDADIQTVLKKARYHKFTLPGGIETNGQDFSAMADAVFSFGVAGKSVLDIGCHHGFYLFEARKRGAAKAVGVEARRHHIEVARLIQKLLGIEDVEYVRGRFPRVRLHAAQFDVVLLMNVVHYTGSVRRARAMILAAARLARERIVLGIRPPASEPGIDAETVKHIETMELREVRVDPQTGRRVKARRALLSHNYVRALLQPIMREVEFLDAPNYQGRFLAIGKR